MVDDKKCYFNDMTPGAQVVNSDPINDILAKTNMECTAYVLLLWNTMLLPYLNPDSKNMRQK